MGTKDSKPAARVANPAGNPPDPVLALSAAEAAKAAGVDESEVLAWALRGERVIVVTTAGQKLEGAL